MIELKFFKLLLLHKKKEKKFKSVKIFSSPMKVTHSRVIKINYTVIKHLHNS